MFWCPRIRGPFNVVGRSGGRAGGSRRRHRKRGCRRSEDALQIFKKSWQRRRWVQTRTEILKTKVWDFRSLIVHSKILAVVWIWGVFSFLHPPAASGKKKIGTLIATRVQSTYLIMAFGAKASLDANKRESSELPSMNFIVWITLYSKRVGSINDNSREEAMDAGGCKGILSVLPHGEVLSRFVRCKLLSVAVLGRFGEHTFWKDANFLCFDSLNGSTWTSTISISERLSAYSHCGFYIRNLSQNEHAKAHISCTWFKREKVQFASTCDK